MSRGHGREWHSRGGMDCRGQRGHVPRLGDALNRTNPEGQKGHCGHDERYKLKYRGLRFYD